MERLETVSLKQTPFGTTADGRQVTAYTLVRGSTELTVLDLGATIHSLVVRDRNGNPVDVVLGCLDLENYEKDTGFLGRTIGRVCNRTENASFTLHRKKYHLPANEGVNHLHGTWNDRVFQVRTSQDGICLSYRSPDGEEGYPGNVEFEAWFTLPDENEVRMEFHAVADADTPINITNHAYFNLAGQGTVKDHNLWLGAKHYCPIRPDNILTGEILPVRASAMDFNEPFPLVSGLESPNQQIQLARGYDHNFVLDGKDGNDFAALLYCPRSGIRMQLFTTQPGIQVYTGNYLQDSPALGKDGKPLVENQGVALETQHYPCSLSHREFPSIILKKGEKFRETTCLCFDTV